MLGQYSNCVVGSGEGSERAEPFRRNGESSFESYWLDDSVKVCQERSEDRASKALKACGARCEVGAVKSTAQKAG